jgi:dolichol-phosphate mannosyltransferase
VSRALVDGAGPLSPIGYKIALELLVRGRPRRIVELPIRFGDRVWGESKLSPRVELEYVAHLVRLYRHRLVSVIAVVLPRGRAWTVGMRLDR